MGGDVAHSLSFFLLFVLISVSEAVLKPWRWEAGDREGEGLV